MTTTAAKRRSSAPGNRQGLVVIGAVIIVVAIIAIIAILLSGNQSGDVNVASLPQERTADGGYVVGNPNAPITIIEFADFACPHCQEYHPTITKFLNDYVVPG